MRLTYILEENLISGKRAAYYSDTIILVSGDGRRRRRRHAAGAIPSVISRGSIEISRRLIDTMVHGERLTYLYILAVSVYLTRRRGRGVERRD